MFGGTLRPRHEAYLYAEQWTQVLQVRPAERETMPS